MGPVDDIDLCFLGRGVVDKIGTDHMFIERPVVLRITGRMNTQVSTSGAQVTFEPLLLIGIEKILRTVQENDDLILTQVGLGKLTRVLGG